MKIQINPTTIIEIEIKDAIVLDDDSVFDEFDYKQAAKEFFNSFNNDSCLAFTEALKLECENEIEESKKSLERITTKYITFKTKDEQRREQISRNIIENTKSF
jgi:hypothetical protein